MSARPTYTQDVVSDLIDGSLPWAQTRQIMSAYKDDDRFEKYIAILQERVPWDDPIVLTVGEHLFIVATAAGHVVKCDCGHEFCDYRENWKMAARVRVRDDAESLEEIYPGPSKPDVEWMELREFICPGCAALLEVEAVPPGFPVLHDFLPDLEAFYEGWLGRPVPTVGG
jgi:acetone carboxylase, gamma subunit